MNVVVYSANYGAFDLIRPQLVPVRMFVDKPTGFRMPGEPEDPRAAAKLWKVRPDIACPDADVTIWIDGSMEVLRADFVERCLYVLGHADALFVPHPFRDDIYEEAELSTHLGKYAGQPLLDQVASYRKVGHPEHWGLAEAGLLVRRHNARVKALGEAWWAEIERWSLQDQLSLPPLLRTMELEYRWWGRSPYVHDLGLVRVQTHIEPDIWIPDPLQGEKAPRQTGVKVYNA